jgi:hypothetical protein
MKPLNMVIFFSQIYGANFWEMKPVPVLKISDMLEPEPLKF